MQKARRTANASAKPRQVAIVLARCDQNDSHARSTKRAVVRKLRCDDRGATQVRSTKGTEVTIDDANPERDTHQLSRRVNSEGGFR